MLLIICVIDAEMSIPIKNMKTAPMMMEIKTANVCGNLRYFFCALMRGVSMRTRKMAKIKGMITGLSQARATPVAINVKMSRHTDCNLFSFNIIIR